MRFDARAATASGALDGGLGAGELVLVVGAFSSSGAGAARCASGWSNPWAGAGLTGAVWIFGAGSFLMKQRGDRQRQAPFSDPGEHDRRFPRQARDGDAPVSFIFGKAKPRRAIRKQGRVTRIEMQAPILHLAQVREQLREQPAPRADDSLQPLDELCVG